MTSSSTEKRFQRYEFLGVYVTTVASLAEIERGTTLQSPFLHKLPLLVGHAMVWSWWYEMRCALLARDKNRVEKLYEAALTLTLRIRLGCTPAQIVIESCAFSEAAYLKYKSMSDDFLTLSRKILHFPNLDWSSAPKLEASLALTGITFQSQALGKQKCQTILALKPFLQDPASSNTFDLLAELCPQLLQEYSKLLRILQAVSKVGSSIKGVRPRTAFSSFASSLWFQV